MLDFELAILDESFNLPPGRGIFKITLSRRGEAFCG